ncbi:MAG: hypothetical protein H7Y00_03725 [Fimbriimonadaceae bacterium]|nr:hypothetical protein [Chitinophagales bacterium]
MWQETQMKKAEEVIAHFNNSAPLHKYLKQYFRMHTNMGSKDRKLLSALVFNYFRLKGERKLEDIRAAITFASAQESLAKDFYKYWITKIQTTTNDIKTYLEFSGENYFPLYGHISHSVKKTEFLHSHMRKSGIWIRCRSKYYEAVIHELKTHKYNYTIAGKDIILFKENYPLDRLESYEKGFFEIQDIASQKVAELFKPEDNDYWWDCCAGSGGKSLSLIDKEENIQLLASDARRTILKNLDDRLKKINFINYKSIELDLSEESSIAALNNYELFDGIIADVPCSGSGTWSRAPEWLSFFTEEILNDYVLKQRKIISNAIQKLKKGSPLIYITCSAYADENENNIQYFSENFPLQLETQKYFQYSKEGGDTLFGAKLIKK